MLGGFGALIYIAGLVIVAVLMAIWLAQGLSEWRRLKRLERERFDQLLESGKQSARVQPSAISDQQSAKDQDKSK